MRSRDPNEAEPTLVVVTDTTVLVNLIHIDRANLFGCIPGYAFVLPDEVINEVTDEAQRDALQKAIDDGFLRRITLTDLREIARKAELSKRLGEGEAACLAIAATRDYVIATDDGRAARTAVELLGDGRVLTTPGLLVLAIRAALITIDEADRYKRTLEARRFVMGFGSFRDVV